MAHSTNPPRNWEARAKLVLSKYGLFDSYCLLHDCFTLSKLACWCPSLGELVKVRHILAATDLTAAGEHAVAWSRQLAAKAGARFTPLLVHFAVPLDDWAAGRNGRAQDIPKGMVVVDGVPAIEIVRYAEAQAVDILVLARSERMLDPGVAVGTSADAVIRRADLPVLVLPRNQDRITRVIAALDGSERGLAVLRLALELKPFLGLNPVALFVEPADQSEAGAVVPSSGRHEFLKNAMQSLNRDPEAIPLVHRTGNVIDEVLRGVSAEAGDLVMVGVRRGGPANPLESTGNGRRILAAARCAVLTVPL